ncbi:MAG TPA: DUF3179 domain-containing (seleno)protein, partial [Tepidisphaeraceae bacterium]|nr:DUF3179 domain-containing (seleno)protein [Tepidisphaeraceae bacterium]
ISFSDFFSEVLMRRSLSIGLIVFLPLFASAAEQKPVAQPPRVIPSEAFESLLHPNCSHCSIEQNRRAAELRDDDRVVCWLQVESDGYINDGAVPIRFFLNKYRVLSDGWGVFVYDPDAGYVRGFAPEGDEFRFHGWRNGVTVIRGKDGTLYSGLTGIAFDGPRKGRQLRPEATLETNWGFWRRRYPAAVAYMMYDKYKPIELPVGLDRDSVASRGAVDRRLAPDTEVLGVWDGKNARAYPIDALAKAGVIHDQIEGGPPFIVLWYATTRTAAAYHQPWGTSGIQGDAGWIFSIDPKAEAAPFVDRRVKIHWDITGRADGGGPRLVWMDGVQVKWFAWAAEHPGTSIYGK